MRRLSMKEQIGVQLCADIAREERQMDEFVKWAQRFRWESMKEEEPHSEIESYGRESFEALFNRRNERHTRLEDDPISG
jgi:hypothetical protein